MKRVDTETYIKELVEAGVPQQMAEAQARALAKVVDKYIAATTEMEKNPPEIKKP